MPRKLDFNKMLRMIGFENLSYISLAHGIVPKNKKTKSFPPFVNSYSVNGSSQTISYSSSSNGFFLNSFFCSNYADLFSLQYPVNATMCKEVYNLVRSNIFCQKTLPMTDLEYLSYDVDDLGESNATFAIKSIEDGWGYGKTEENASRALHYVLKITKSGSIGTAEFKLLLVPFETKYTYLSTSYQSLYSEGFYISKDLATNKIRWYLSGANRWYDGLWAETRRYDPSISDEYITILLLPDKTSIKCYYEAYPFWAMTPDIELTLDYEAKQITWFNGEIIYLTEDNKVRLKELDGSEMLIYDFEDTELKYLLSHPDQDKCYVFGAAGNHLVIENNFSYNLKVTDSTFSDITSISKRIIPDIDGNIWLEYIKYNKNLEQLLDLNKSNTNILKILPNFDQILFSMHKYGSQREGAWTENYINGFCDLNGNFINKSSLVKIPSNLSLLFFDYRYPKPVLNNIGKIDLDTPKPTKKIILYSKPGAYTFTVPEGITSIDVVVIGGGATYATYNQVVYGSTPEFETKTVTPGEEFELTVGNVSENSTFDTITSLAGLTSGGVDNSFQHSLFGTLCANYNGGFGSGGYWARYDSLNFKSWYPVHGAVIIEYEIQEEDREYLGYNTSTNEWENGAAAKVIESEVELPHGITLEFNDQSGTQQYTEGDYFYFSVAEGIMKDTLRSMTLKYEWDTRYKEYKTIDILTSSLTYTIPEASEDSFWGVVSLIKKATFDGSTPITFVSGAPLSGQVALNHDTGVVTFNVADVGRTFQMEYYVNREMIQ